MMQREETNRERLISSCWEFNILRLYSGSEYSIGAIQLCLDSIIAETCRRQRKEENVKTLYVYKHKPHTLLPEHDQVS